MAVAPAGLIGERFEDTLRAAQFVLDLESAPVVTGATQDPAVVRDDQELLQQNRAQQVRRVLVPGDLRPAQVGEQVGNGVARRANALRLVGPLAVLVAAATRPAAIRARR